MVRESNMEKYPILCYNTGAQPEFITHKCDLFDSWLYISPEVVAHVLCERDNSLS